MKKKNPGKPPAATCCEDGELFRLWIREAAERPSRVALMLAGCVTEKDYRVAMQRLRDVQYSGPITTVPVH